ncbi:hypothetical protein WQ54_11595 [Bacillus sp. SA1-12]|uniref:tubby C-terminal domain-like protein n=1 Tax=Bacillus sp. SA1-12 TaxID=1455638 RepID=UPI000625F606|nr:hypothetical protein [Bacillus sp. SA1-12]KKI92075.1 hypothetical protein WQ54_11595 [Bacillus sp. SA1-12]
MIELILLFVLLLLTALARYLVFGVFEPLSFAMIFLFPVAAFAIFIISKRFANKELSYQPKDIVGWSFYNIQKSLIIKKPLFEGNNQRGYIKRYFPKKWQYAFGDILGFNWYLCLEIQIDQDTYDVRWYREKWLTNQDQWKIYKNGKQIGGAHTLINLKNSSKLKEAIVFRFNDTECVSSASTMTSTISLSQNEELLGTLKRNHILSNVQIIDIQEQRLDYIVALIVHSYFFKNK